MMKPLACNGSTCRRLCCAVLLLGVKSIRGKTQESSASWTAAVCAEPGTFLEPKPPACGSVIPLGQFGSRKAWEQS